MATPLSRNEGSVNYLSFESRNERMVIVVFYEVDGTRSIPFPPCRSR